MKNEHRKERISSFEDLEAWQMARQLVNAIYVTHSPQKYWQQIFDCAVRFRRGVSIMSNIWACEVPVIYVYVLRCEKDKLFYTGCTRRLRERLRLHESGNVASTAKRRPLRLIYYEACLDKRDAFRREKYLKSTYGKRYIRTRCRNYFTG